MPEVGSRRRLRFDEWSGEPPVAGDIIRTFTGLCYEILSYRDGKPGSNVKYSVEVEVLERDCVLYGEEGVRSMMSKSAFELPEVEIIDWFARSNVESERRRRG